jgi:hypothetical protein
MTVPVFGAPHYFSPIDVDKRIGRALVRMLFLKFGAVDAGDYADADALRAAESRTLADVETIATSLAHVVLLGRTYAWTVTDERADDGLNVTPETLRALLDAGRVRSPLPAEDLAFLKQYSIFRSGVTLDGEHLEFEGKRCSNNLLDEAVFG